MGRLNGFYLTCALLIPLVSVALPAVSADKSNQLQASREQIYKALAANKVFHPDRQIAHLSHACSLRIGGQWYPVVDLGETVKGAMVPRGVNTIIVLSPDLKPVRRINYVTEHPLFCLEDELFVFGDVTIDDVLGTGNVLKFSEKGTRLELRSIEANDRPIPPTSQRRQPVQ